MILKNGNIFIDGKFVRSDLKITDGKIAEFCSGEGDALDCDGKYIIPGLVDIHTHGCIGYDFSFASSNEINKMRKHYLKNGITAIVPTTVALSDDDIINAVDSIKRAANNDHAGAEIIGVNLEGPYLSPKKCGAHDKNLLKAPDLEFIEKLGDFIKIVNVAPEYDNAVEFIKNFKGKTSIAHTDCDYDTALNAIRTGADHITHIFNAMNGLHHRKPGVVGAFFDSDAVAEIICDGIHISPAVLRMMFSLKPEKLAVISDSMSAAGLSDGNYKLGNLSVIVNHSVATLPDGTIAGSTMNIYEMMRKLISIGIEPEKAVYSVSAVPADSIGIGDKHGHIKINRNADIIIANKDFSIDRIFFRGNQI